MASDTGNKGIRKYKSEPLDPEKVVGWECPSGFVMDVYPVFGRYTMKAFLEVDFAPDPRTHNPILHKMKIHDDDVLICAYSKAGTHWVWEICKMLKRGEAIYDPSPKETAMLEFHSLDILENISRPRIFNTHLDYDQIPEGFRSGKGKVIFVQRNPKDICVSFYNHWKGMVMKFFEGDWNDFVYCWIHHGGVYRDWFDYTRLFEEGLKTNKDLECLSVYYEDIKRNPVKTTLELAKHMEVPCDDKLAEDIADKCNFHNLRNASATLKFDHITNTKPNAGFKNPSSMYRKGEVGDWKNWFTVAQSEEFDAVFNKRMAGSDFSYTFT